MRFIYDLIYTVTAFVLLLAIACCSHSQKKESFVSINELKAKVTDADIDLTDRKKFESLLNSIKQDLIVAKKQGRIQSHTWSKIGQTLETYKSLLHLQRSGQIWIPEKTNLRLQVTSFCIDLNRSAPEPNEVFEWVLGEPATPLYYKILKYYSIHPDVGRESVQELLWNLSNKTVYEDYPDLLKNLLNKIDSDAAKKLPSAFREKAIDTGVSALENISAIELQGIIRFIQGQYYTYEQFRESMERLRSSYSLPDQTQFSKIPDIGDLLATSHSNGYKNQTLSFYNLSDIEKTVEPNRYYLKPLRKDVQRIALTSATVDPTYFINRLNQFFKETLSDLGVLYPGLTNEEKALIRKYPYESLRVAWYQARSEFATGRFFKDGRLRQP